MIKDNFQLCPPFQTWEASSFPMTPYRPMPLAITLGQKARKADIKFMAL
jgi:hypothetical protein